MSIVTKNTAGFSQGNKVTITEDWTPPNQPKVYFPKGTYGKIVQILSNGEEARLNVPSPQSPTMSTVIPVRLLKRT